MSTLPLEEKRNTILLSLYHLHTTKGQHVKVDELQQLSNIGSDFYPVLRQIGANGKGWLKHSNLVVRMTADGIDEAEKLIKMQMAQKERLVLQKIYDLGGPTHMDFVSIDTLIRELGMQFRELNAVLLDFERRKGWLEGPDEAVRLTPPGIRQVEEPDADRAVGVIYETHFHAPFQGGFNQGPGGTQHISIESVKNEFDDAVFRLLKGVEDSTTLSPVQKMTVTNDIKTIQQLGQLDKTTEVVETANSRIDAVSSVISTTADLVSLGIVIIPIFRACFGI